MARGLGLEADHRAVEAGKRFALMALKAQASLAEAREVGQLMVLFGLEQLNEGLRDSDEFNSKKQELVRRHEALIQELGGSAGQ